MRKFELNHEGYILESNRQRLPKVARIYIVYKCFYNSLFDTVDVKDILYIGETENIYERHNDTPSSPGLHEHHSDFIKEAGGEGNVCYGWFPTEGMTADERKWVQDVLIHMQQPPINTDAKDHYNHPAVEIKIHGVPDAWKMSHFAHPFNYSDEIERKDLWEIDL